jgi:hypothetical protein
VTIGIRRARTPVAPARPTVPTEYPLLVDKHDYLPAADEVVDGWLQAANSSNVRTTAKIIRDLCPRPKMVIDPFVGTGSAAVAARLLDLPFFGIELDAVSAAVSAAKALAGPRHADLLADQPLDLRLDGLPAAVAEFHRELPQPDAHVISCLSLVAAVRAHVDPQPGVAVALRERMVRDLRGFRPPAPRNHVAWGDATTAAAWQRLGGAGLQAVVYTSPPFGVSSPRFQLPPAAHAVATEIFTRIGYRMPSAEPPEFGSYAELALGMLEQAMLRFDKVTVIAEHEPADDGSDVRFDLIDAVCDRFAGRVRQVRVLETKAFSGRGMLSLIVCDLRG